MSDVVSDVVDTVKGMVHGITGYDEVREARKKAERKRKEIMEQRMEAEKKREAAEKKKRAQMESHVREQAGRKGHGANIAGGGLLAQDDEMNPFASAS